MTSRRGFIASLAVAPVAIVAPAFATPAATQHPDWLSLLADERRTFAEFDHMCAVQEAADDRFFDAREMAERAWQRDFDAHRALPHVPPIEGESALSLEARVQDAIKKWNAENQRMRAEREALDGRLRVETGLVEVDQRHERACSAHMAAIRAILAYPSRDPDIIAHKLQMIIDHYGDDNGDYAVLLASIDGEGLA